MAKKSGLKVVGYARVSTSEQASEGVSLDAQVVKVQGYAALHDLDLIGVEIDAGVSAKTLDRPGLGRVLGMLDRGEASGVVIAKLDRLSRSVSDWNKLIDRHFGPKKDCQLFSVADSIDTRSHGGRLVLNILMSVAQWEREAIADRTKDALAHKRSMGDPIGPTPYGSKLDAETGKVVPDVEMQLTIAAMVGWRAQGWSDRQIAAELDRIAVPTKRGGRWTHVVVGRLLKETSRPEKSGRKQPGQPHVTGVGS